MIVKNESKIIAETLHNISKYIDYWIISDTGSTDNTIEVITNTFKELGIEGKIFTDEWKDFGTNRTIALKHAFDNYDGNYDYIFIMDADDLIMGDLVFPSEMNADGYYLKFGTKFVYKRQLILKASLNWIFRGVVHEFLQCVDIKNPQILSIDGNYWIESRRMGDRSNDPNKYLNDALKMEKALKEGTEPDLIPRYKFYIAQSYYDYGNYEKSLEWYKKRVEEGGWIEEVYYSSLRVGDCMCKLNYSLNEIVKQYLITNSLIETRPEAFFNLTTYWITKSANENDDKKKNQILKKAHYYLEMLSKLSYDKIRDSNRLFLNKEIFDWKAKYNLCVVSNMLEKHSQAYELSKELLDKNEIRMNIDLSDNIEMIKNKNFKYDENKLIEYPKKIIEQLVEKNKKKLNNKKIVLTMTTCKRLDLFVKTINSFINCCRDIDLIDHWIIIDDNSSIDDREFMKWEYPFVEWIFKNEEQKGHSKSMNMLIELTTDYEYVLHLEDDWMFLESTYLIKPALDILESDNYNLIDKRAIEQLEGKEICQVLFNKNYAETLDNVISGGLLMQTTSYAETKFLLHEHYSNTNDYPLKNRINCAYWPHFSFRPSIFKRKIFDKLGEFEYNGFFERDYANKYFNSNFLSAFLDKVSCIHIGKLTNQEGTNAYDLNKVNQNISKNYANNFNDKRFLFVPNLDSFKNDIIHFETKTLQELAEISLEIDDCIGFNTYGYFKNKINSDLIQLRNYKYKPDGLYINILRTHDEFICVNLARRVDRKEKMIKLFEENDIKYRFFEAVDGMELKPSVELVELFENNDFGSLRGYIGCALTHKKIWEELIEDKIKNYYMVCEDDITLCKNFNLKLKNIQKNILELGEWDVIFLGYSSLNKNINNENTEIILEDFDTKDYIGGFFGYVISKSGATKLLDYIKINGIKHGIDYLIKICPNLNIWNTNNFLIYSEIVNSKSINKDSDVQLQTNYLDIYSDDNFQYIRNFDSPDNDIVCIKGLSLEEMKQKALREPNCIGFNSLGFFKSKIESFKKTQYFQKFDDGIYIKKEYLTKIKDINTNQYVNTKIRIKMICNWTDSKTLCDEWNWMSKGDYKWNNLEITWEDTDIDYYVIINKPKPGDFYIPEKTIIFQMEPQCNNQNQTWGVKTWGEWANPDPNKFLMVRTSKNYLNNVLWQFSLSYNYFKSTPIVKDESKGDIISSICSSKYFDPGHIKRIDFLSYLESKNDSSIQLHIYNKDNLHGFKSYQGQLTQYVDKHLGIIPYKYYFMCENNSEKNFITEKLWEPIICETLVFYWGCPNVSEYINPLAYVQLDMEDFEKSYQIIKDAIENNLWERRIKYIREEKEKILDYYNFFPTIERIINLNDNIKCNNCIIDNDLLFNKIFNDTGLLNICNIKNVCFIHSCNLYEENNGVVLELDYLLDYLKTNNCIEVFDYIIINNIGFELNIEHIYTKFDINKIKIINLFKNCSLYEIPTIKLMWYFSNKYFNTNILYLHTKGITYDKNSIIKKNVNDWTDYMLYYLVNKYHLPISLLNDYDSIGVNFNNMDSNGKLNKHWSGNFWWSKTNYIKTLNISNLRSKHDAEWFILSSNVCKYFELVNSGINHYENEFKYNNYQIDSLKFNNENFVYLLNFIKNTYIYPSAWKGHFEFSMWLINLIKPKVIVELGVDFAHSSFSLASELNQDCVLYAIDSFEGDNHSRKRNTLNIVNETYKFLLEKKLLKYDNINFVKGYFDDECIKFNKVIDLLHIDGLHTYDAVKNDFNNWFPKTSNNSVVIFHDTISFPNDVGKFFNELPYYKTNIIHSAGLGILSKNKEIIDTINNLWINNLNYNLIAEDKYYFEKFIRKIININI